MNENNWFFNKRIVAVVVVLCLSIALGAFVFDESITTAVCSTIIIGRTTLFFVMNDKKQE
jgi:hypothetical protein